MKRQALVLISLGLVAMISGCGDSHEAVMKDQVSILKEFAETIDGIKDDQSAKAAEPKLEALGNKLDAVVKRAKALPQATPEVQRALAETYMKELTNVTKTIMGAMARAASDPQLMEAFKQALAKFNAKFLEAMDDAKTPSK